MLSCTSNVSPAEKDIRYKCFGSVISGGGYFSCPDEKFVSVTIPKSSAACWPAFPSYPNADVVS